MSSTKWNGPVLVLCRYKPHEGRDEDVRALVARHGPVLLAQGLVTPRPFVHATAKDGSLIEIFEWKSEEASRSVHGNPAVMEIWEGLGECARFAPMAELSETQQPFAHFAPLDPGQAPGV
jgi:hypothetical protein